MGTETDTEFDSEIIVDAPPLVFSSERDTSVVNSDSFQRSSGGSLQQYSSLMFFAGILFICLAFNAIYKHKCQIHLTKMKRKFKSRKNKRVDVYFDEKAFFREQNEEWDE